MSKTSKNRRSISYKDKIKILREQDYKCSNIPGSKLYNLDNYECPMWKHNHGSFDKSGFEADHIIEYCLSQDSSLSNMQLLCHSCHAQKTRNFAENKNKINLENIESKTNCKTKTNCKNKTNCKSKTNCKNKSNNKKPHKVLYQCNDCDAVFKYNSKLEEHLEKKLEAPCKPLTEYKKNLIKKLIIQNNAIYSCRICNKLFNKVYNLHRHYTCLMHLEKEKLFLLQNDNYANKLHNSKDKTKKLYNKTINNSTNKSHNNNIINSSICLFGEDDVFKQISLLHNIFPFIKETNKLLSPCKNSALEILKMKYSIKNKNYYLIQDMIKKCNNYRYINMISNIIIRSFRTNIYLSVNFIKQKIIEEIEMQNYVNTGNICKLGDT